MAERDVVSRCVAQLCALGATHRHLIYRGRKGCPDTGFFFDHHGYMCVIEFKDGKELRREQERERLLWLNSGVDCFAVRSHEEREAVVEIVRAKLEKMK